MTIELQFAGGRGVLGRTITWFGHGSYVHVDSILPERDPNGKLQFLGARFKGGVLIRPEGYKKFHSILRVSLPCDETISNKYYEFLHQQLGKPYDYKAAFGGFIFNSNWRNPDKWFCSELVAAGLEYCYYFKYQLFADANKIDPSALLLVLSSTADIPAPEA